MRRTFLLLAIWAAGLGVAGAADERRPGTQGEASSAAGLAEFVVEAAAKHGDVGERAARFLLEHMPEADRGKLAPAFLMENLDLALRARMEFPWARAVPEEIFLNDVLPYAVLDEPRDPWRAEFYAMAREIVKERPSASDAAQALNREFFKRVGVHYDIGRKRANQSARESRESGRATCTGLAIILVEACRSVGIPARAVGIASWPHKTGNHTWVEFWDGGWHFLGADEYNPTGPDRAWFVEDARRARAGDPAHGIFASSWRAEGAWFTPPWNSGARLAAVEVTERYAAALSGAGVSGVASKDAKAGEDAAAPQVELHFRVRVGGDRVVAQVALFGRGGKAAGEVTTKAGRADLNDMPSLRVTAGTRYRCIVRRGAEAREAVISAGSAPSRTVELRWEAMAPSLPELASVGEWLLAAPGERGPAPGAALSRTQAGAVLALLWSERRAEIEAERSAELEALAVQADGKTLKLKETVFGKEPPGGRSLWISLHGGGNAPAELNDGQWLNQSGLYRLNEGIYVAPRAPTNTWNLWHEPHIDPLFDRLIEDYVALRGVNPNRVYLLGYSAGGDGVYQLAPRMADRFAAVAMMAGHPNDASPLGLRNLPFALFVGEKDGGYGRNAVAREWRDKLDRLEREDRGGYPHFVRIVAGKGHWMDGEDAGALPWMAGRTRDPWPKRVVWEQGHRVGRRFYWLGVPERAGEAAAKEPAPVRGALVRAEVVGQRVMIESRDYRRLVLRLSDALLDLDQPVTVVANGRTVFSGRVTRTVAALATSLAERADPSSAASVLLEVEM
jgi:hypothetical protein